MRAPRSALHLSALQESRKPSRWLGGRRFGARMALVVFVEESVFVDRSGARSKPLGDELDRQAYPPRLFNVRRRWWLMTATPTPTAFPLPSGRFRPRLNLPIRPSTARLHPNCDGRQQLAHTLYQRRQLVLSRNARQMKPAVKA